jgi:uncharacterized iron-regulated protein
VEACMRSLFSNLMRVCVLGWVCASAQAQVVAPTAGAEAAHPLLNRVWDVRAGQFVGTEQAMARAAQARYVLLGEQHDSVAHHAVQLQVLQGLHALGRKVTLAMEQFDSEHQGSLSRAQQAGERDAERLAEAGQLNKKGWRWPLYKDLIDWAAQHQWPLRGVNLSRREGRKIAMGEIEPTLPALPPEQVTNMENDVVSGHCGHRPAPDMLAALVSAQRARDLRMAEGMDTAEGPVVLIAGLGHVRSDRAVPRYLAEPERALVVGLFEVQLGKTDPAAYATAGLDLLWFTPAQVRTDPCTQALPQFKSSAIKKETP